MNFAQWRTLGYATLIRVAQLPSSTQVQACVCLWHRERHTCFCIPVMGGKWVEIDDLSNPPWTPMHLESGFEDSQLYQSIQSTLKMCYCKPKDTCDFCGGTKDPFKA